MSDTHGSKPAMKRVWEHARENAAENYEFFIHAGDHYSDAEYFSKLSGLEYRCVKGNCDYGDAPVTDVVEFGGNRIFLTHGHKYHDTTRLSLAAEQENCTALVFGHTHVSFCGYMGSVLVLNPGSPARPRDSKPGYAVITLDAGVINARIVKL